jgi:hypothetical protein
MANTKTFKLEAEVTVRSNGTYLVKLTGSGFSGVGDAYTLEVAFQKAYDELTTSLLAGTQDEDED